MRFKMVSKCQMKLPMMPLLNSLLIVCFFDYTEGRKLWDIINKLLNRVAIDPTTESY